MVIQFEQPLRLSLLQMIKPVSPSFVEFYLSGMQKLQNRFGAALHSVMMVIGEDDSVITYGIDPSGKGQEPNARVIEHRHNVLLDDPEALAESIFIRMRPAALQVVRFEGHGDEYRTAGISDAGIVKSLKINQEITGLKPHLLVFNSCRKATDAFCHRYRYSTDAILATQADHDAVLSFDIQSIATALLDPSLGCQLNHAMLATIIASHPWFLTAAAIDAKAGGELFDGFKELSYLLAKESPEMRNSAIARLPEAGKELPSAAESNFADIGQSLSILAGMPFSPQMMEGIRRVQALLQKAIVAKTGRVYKSMETPNRYKSFDGTKLSGLSFNTRIFQSNVSSALLRG